MRSHEPFCSGITEIKPTIVAGGTGNLNGAKAIMKQNVNPNMGKSMQDDLSKAIISQIR